MRGLGSKARRSGHLADLPNLVVHKAIVQQLEGLKVLGKVKESARGVAAAAFASFANKRKQSFDRVVGTME